MKKPLKLPARLDGPAAAKLASKLVKLSGKPVCLNGAEVTFGGALGLQLLVAARRKWCQDDSEFMIENPSVALVDSCRILGIGSEEIGISKAAGASR